MKYVALLRGINVGGKNLVPMKDLAAMFTGCSDVSTYIQSGNVVFSTKNPEKIPPLIAGSIKKKFKIEVPVIVRSHDELAKISQSCPFDDVDHVMVMVLAHSPSASAVKALDPKRSPTDQFAVKGREIFLHCPNGYGNSKLTNAWFDSKLSTVSTGRNWRTLQKLLGLTQP
jgi:uncharacterized protein (DUF1697 family)